VTRTGRPWPEAYDVEDALFGERTRWARYRKVPGGLSVPDQRTIAHRVAQRLELPPPLVVRRRGNPHTFASRANPTTNTITMGALAGPVVICHEVAHLAAPRCDDQAAWHGAAWQRAFVDAVRGELGDHHAVRLDRAFMQMRARHQANRARGAADRGRR